ncbi:MAG: GH3 auxin-responsive promoter family protein, partial [Oricola sp.]
MTAQSWQRLRCAGRLELAALNLAQATPRRVQEDLLAAILRREATSRFGVAHGFASIGDVETFRARVPVADYEYYRPWIDSIAQGERDALTATEPVCFEQTGGSSGGRKLIPYTAAGLEGFRRSVLAWMGDLIDGDPAIADGRAYFAISPSTRAARRMEGGLPVGLASDAAYFGEDLIADVAAIMTGAEALSGIADFDAWQQATLAWLAATADLTLISVWSPTFFTTLLDALERDPEPALKALRDGNHGLPALPDRSIALAGSLASGRLDAARLWPQLRLVSAWADSGSARFAV